MNNEDAAAELRHAKAELELVRQLQNRAQATGVELYAQMQHRLFFWRVYALFATVALLVQWM